MAATLSLTHVDTCLACYLTDHCNGDDEVLFGVEVWRETTHGELKEGLIGEFLGSCDERLDDVAEEAFRAVVEAEFSGCDLTKPFDPSLDPLTEEDDGGDPCVAWFRLDIERGT
jgi:hypothetical protein